MTVLGQSVVVVTGKKETEKRDGNHQGKEGQLKRDKAERKGIGWGSKGQPNPPDMKEKGKGMKT